ncbi:hypothetical protein ACMFMG_004203 [Clarireedia jacksonii]
MAKPFIAAYHDGASSPDSYITSDQLVYWYRPNLRTLNCDATDTTMVPASNSSGNYFEGRPNGWEDMQDSVFVVALLKSAGTVTVMSGNNVTQFAAPAGVSSYQVDMQVGKQQFFLQRNKEIVLQAVSLHDVTDVCICGIYNFNAYVGTVPDGPSDPLQHDGLASLTAGLHVSTCSASPSLPTTTIQPTTTPPGGGSVVPPTTTSTTSTTTKSPTTTPPITTTTSTSSTTSTTSSTTTSATPSGTCVAGTGPGNYIGLCQFSCNYGFCPSPCTCTSYSATGIAAPPISDTPGVPLPGEDSTYIGLCGFTCNHGYCPPTACMYVSSSTTITTSTITSQSTTFTTSTTSTSTSQSTTSTTSTPSTSTSQSTTSTTSTTSSAAPSATICVAGTGPGNYVGLCNFCCNYGYCPPGPCTCTKYDISAVPEKPVTNTTGYPLANEDNSYLGLCSYACNHGYCPETACRTSLG